MRFEDLCHEFGVDFTYKESKGWFNVCCPFCPDGDEEYHLGYSESSHFFKCWRCGKHSVLKGFMGLFKVDAIQARQLLLGFKRKLGVSLYAPAERDIEVQLPAGAGDLLPAHIDYLEGRGLDVKELQEVWGLKGVGKSCDFRYNWRIVIPIYFQGVLVTFQTRAISGDSAYLGADPDLERLPIKHTLYGFDFVVGDTVVIVEGVVDVWKFGPGTVGTYGTAWTPEQLRLLKDFQKRIVVYDPGEVLAQKSAKDLAKNLSVFRGKTVVADLGSGRDPGSYPIKRARRIREQILSSVT